MGPDSSMPKLLCVVGARPNFMKIAPILRALGDTAIAFRLIHTGQHYDVKMNQRFFEQLAIPRPDVDLEVGSASHAVQTAEIMRRFEAVVDEEQAHAVLVVGDVNSTIACALVAAKKGLKVIHGLRPGGGQKRAQGHPRGGRTSQFRPAYARGDQPGVDRSALGSAVHHRA